MPRPLSLDVSFGSAAGQEAADQSLYADGSVFPPLLQLALLPRRPSLLQERILTDVRLLEHSDATAGIDNVIPGTEEKMVFQTFQGHS